MALMHNSTWTWLQKQKLLPLFGSYSVTAAKMVENNQHIIKFWFLGYNLILIFSHLSLANVCAVSDQLFLIKVKADRGKKKEKPQTGHILRLA